MSAPVRARRRLRRLFDPVRGWVRRSERALNLFLSKRVLHHVPGISRPYTLLLDRWLTVSETEVFLPRLGAGFDGTRVLLLTDVHVGPFLAPSALERTFRRLLSLEPDLILLGGDFTTSRADEFAPFARAFGLLRAPLGVYGVLGNHDHYNHDPAGLRRSIEAAGVSLLHNEAVAVERAGDRLVLAGIDDLNAGEPNLDQALASARSFLPDDTDPATGPILLSHNPDVFFEATERGVPLVLAGHTHAGQVRIPGLPVLVRMSRYRLDEGSYRCNGARLIVSRGLGVVGLPLRTFCPPEAVLVELRRG